MAGVWGKSTSSTPEWVVWKHRSLSNKHCEVCLKLDRCWFAKQNTPPWPQHFLCHCVLEKLSYTDVLTKSSAVCSYSKFDPYLFDVQGEYRHGKGALFESWGYTVEDSQYLKEEFEKQALQKYISGDYQLGVLNKHGQRISIRIEIKNKKNGGWVSFITGWLVKPNGQITLNTPYGGK